MEKETRIEKGGSSALKHDETRKSWCNTMDCVWTTIFEYKSKVSLHWFLHMVDKTDESSRSFFSPKAVVQNLDRNGSMEEDGVPLSHPLTGWD